MLVLMRRKGERILIDNGRITIVVVGVRGDKVRLGIVAPPEIPVHREEVHKAIQDWRRRQLP